MRACYIEEFGPPQVLRLGEQARPVPQGSQLLVKVHAAGVNPLDHKTRAGKVRLIMPRPMPLVLGNELSGVVVSGGPAAHRFKAGDAVFARVGIERAGAFAEYALVEEDHAAAKPPSLTHVQAAAMPLAALTAWQALFEAASLQAGQTVLVHAGSGGVGSFAIQLARHAGARVLTTASARNADLVRGLGADVVIDYTRERFEDAAPPCDLILDTLGGDVQRRSFGRLAPRGTLVSLTALPERSFARRFGLHPLWGWLFHALGSAARRRARRAGGRYVSLFMHPSGEQLAQLGALADAGLLKPVVDRVFALEQAAQALALVESGRARGKVVIAVVAQGEPSHSVNGP